MCFSSVSVGVEGNPEEEQPSGIFSGIGRRVSRREPPCCTLIVLATIGIGNDLAYGEVNVLAVWVDLQKDCKSISPG